MVLSVAIVSDSCSKENFLKGGKFISLLVYPPLTSPVRWSRTFQNNFSSVGKSSFENPRRSISTITSAHFLIAFVDFISLYRLSPISSTTLSGTFSHAFHFQVHRAIGIVTTKHKMAVIQKRITVMLNFILLWFIVCPPLTLERREGRGQNEVPVFPHGTYPHTQILRRPFPPYCRC